MKKLFLWLPAAFLLLAGHVNAEDYTSYITNPSFENDATTGWTVSGMQRQSNDVFSIKNGTYYLESWVGIGQQLGNHSVSQTLTNLPSGNYTLSVAALHIQQSGAGSTTNSGNAQTGVYLFAGTARQAVTSMNTYTLSFAVINAQSDIEIGLVAENATGNYLCVDNFQLEYTGALDINSYRTELQNQLNVAQELLDLGVQNSVATTLQQAMSTAQSAMSGNSQSAMESALTSLNSAIEQGKASRARYDKLEARLEYAQKVLGWWEGVAYRATGWSQLQSAITTANSQSTNYALTDSQLEQATSTLNTAIAAVDKSIYCSGSACGSDADLQNSANQWCYERSMQSKHWILFWEAGYGTTVPAAVPNILEKADQIFECYANDLGYITINQGTSKTDTYKMIIRLRYTTDWEASGSGIDNQIGLLTLSNGAHTSRSGQTVAHEIGHCFQYQVHCDNNNWNGWMYNWGSSTYNVFWEMCAQWQAYKFYPNMQFVWDSNQGNDWFGGTINGLHRHPLAVDLRYNNYFIQDYMCHKQGSMQFLGRMWNESQSPEDPLQAYMRLTMTGTTAQKLAQLGDEMWEYGARMTTFDMDPIRDYGASRIGFRTQTAMTLDADSYWWPNQDNCIENFGNNAIRLNVPSTAKTVYVEFEGEAGADGYNAYNTTRAGWRLGFVALKKDGTRVYGDITSASYASPKKTVSFACPANVKYLWLVVSGAPTTYWTRDWLSWSEESDVEQWPYRVKFHQTNLYGQTNNNTVPDGSGDTPDPEEPEVNQNPAAGQTTFDITHAMAPWLSTASMGEYTNNGFGVGTWGNYTGSDGATLAAPFVEKWVSSGNNLPDASMQQTLSELPNGIYYIGGSFIATSQNLNNDNIGGVTFWAGNQSISLATEDGVPEIYSLRVEVTDGTLTFGVTTDATNANWVAVDNLFLLWAGNEASYYAKATSTSPVRVPIVNPRMEDGLNGWTLNGGWQRQGASYNNFDPDFMERWTNYGSYLSDGSALQLVNLNPGTYQLKAAVNATQQNDATIVVEGVSLCLGDSSVVCHTGNGQPEVFYTPQITFNGGNAQLGLFVSSTTANWVAWDNVVLYCYAAQNVEAPYWRALRACKAAQTEYESTTAAAATSALAQYEWTQSQYTTKTQEEIDAAIDVLTNGTNIATANRVATSVIRNANFHGSVNNLAVQGSGGRVNYPSEWTFVREYEGWNDTYVDTNNGLFNAWAGVITQAELYQALTALPNGTYRLMADIRVDNTADTSQTTLYATTASKTVRSNVADSEIAGSTTDFATYAITFTVTDNIATIGILSNHSFFQLKNIVLKYLIEDEVHDVNIDGQWNNADVAATANIILGRKPHTVSYDHTAADIDGNGSVALHDLTSLVNLLQSR